MRQTVGHVSILVNNAGTVHGQQVLDMSCEDFEQSLKVNTLAHIWVSVLYIDSVKQNKFNVVMKCVKYVKFKCSFFRPLE